MKTADWLVLAGTLCAIIIYGIYKSKSTKDLNGYFRGNQTMPWYLILLSIMGTQASAITFLSAPGQAYSDGMRFVQYYLGLPIAMIVICVFLVPTYHRLNVYTAYELLERRFDKRTRIFTALLFLIARGLSTGISIYAPSIILSSLFSWNIYFTNVVMGGLLIIYTVTGGAKAVAFTQQIQFAIIFIGMFLAGYMVVHLLPDNVGFMDALNISGEMGKLNVITTGITDKGFDWSDKYNIFSGIIGGFFLSLSYFGTDQSQVGRYLTAKSMKESRTGLLMNGLVKIPMQFLILLIGVLVFSFYQFYSAPVFFNETQIKELRNTAVYADSLKNLEVNYTAIQQQKKELVHQYVLIAKNENEEEKKSIFSELNKLEKISKEQRNKVKSWISSETVKGDANDSNYIFLRFVVDFLPTGLVGLLIAVIFLAAWGSIAAALNSLASSSIIDLHQSFTKIKMTESSNYWWSKFYTFIWGIFCVFIACFAHNIGNSLIEAVNVLGSLFYGTILGVFITALWLKRVGGKAVFFATLIGQIVVLILYAFTPISFLWYNVIGCFVVMFLAMILSYFQKKTKSYFLNL
jgi:SSS family transporter